MDVDDLERIEDRLDAYLARFGDCSGRSDTRVHLTTRERVHFDGDASPSGFPALAGGALL